MNKAPQIQNTRYINQKCGLCNGFGTLKWGSIICRACNGLGVIVVDQQTGLVVHKGERQNEKYK